MIANLFRKWFRQLTSRYPSTHASRTILNAGPLLVEKLEDRTLLASLQVIGPFSFYKLDAELQVHQGETYQSLRGLPNTETLSMTINSNESAWYEDSIYYQFTQPHNQSTVELTSSIQAGGLGPDISSDIGFSTRASVSAGLNVDWEEPYTFDHTVSYKASYSLPSIAGSTEHTVLSGTVPRTPPDGESSEKTELTLTSFTATIGSTFNASYLTSGTGLMQGIGTVSSFDFLSGFDSAGIKVVADPGETEGTFVEVVVTAWEIWVSTPTYFSIETIYGFTVTPAVDLLAGSMSADLDSVSLTYNVEKPVQFFGPKVVEATPIGLYWSDDTEFQPGPNGDAIAFSFQSERSVGMYSKEISLTELSPSSGQQYLLMVVDPPSADKPFGDVKESGEDNNVQYLSVEFRADDMKYINSEKLQDDYVEFSYQVPSSITEAALNIHWSPTIIDSATSFDAWLSPASSVKRILLTGTDVSPGHHTKKIPVSELGSRPAQADYLVLHVDSGDGTKFDGDFPEQNPRNNFFSLDIRPDIIVNSVSWSPVLDGADVQYTVKNRAFVPASGIVVFPLWDDTIAGLPLNAPRDAVDLPIHAGQLSFLPEQARTLKVVFDPNNLIDEVDDTGNNERSVGVNSAHLRPEITFVETADRIRKLPYTVQVKVQSRAPMNVHYQLDWKENALAPEAPQDIRVYDPSVNEYDALLGPIARRSFDNYSFDLLAGKPKTISLGATDGIGDFRRTWNWIPPIGDDQTPYTMMVEFLSETTGDEFMEAYGKLLEKANEAKLNPIGALEDLGTAVQGVSEITRALDATNFPNTYPIAKVHYLVTVTARSTLAQPVTGPENQATVTLKVDQKNVFNLEAFRGASLSAATAVAKVSEEWDEENGESLEAVFQFLGLIDSINNAYKKALDPPDPNFTSIVQLQPPEPLPPVGNWHPINQNGLQADQLINALDNAIWATEDRWLGASIAGDSQWASKQLVALSDYATQATAAYMVAVRIGALTDLSSQTVTSSALRDMIATGEVPPSLAAEFANAGATPEAIELFKNVLISAGDTTSYPNRVRALKSVSAALATEKAISALIEAVGIRIDVLGLPVRSPTVDELAWVAGERVEVERLIGDQLPTDAVLVRINGFIGGVRSLILETNNLTELVGNLLFGYGALFAFSQLGATPADYVAVVDKVETSGRLASALADSLRSAFYRSELRFSLGDITGGFEAIGEAGNLVSLATSSEIEPEFSRQLQDALNYLIALNIPLIPNNVPPWIASIGNHQVNEGTVFSISVSANDPNSGDTLTFSLDAGAPAAADINVTTGDFRWLSTDGDSSAQVTVRVTDNGEPHLSSTQTFTISVKNTVPSATIAGPATGVRGQPCQFTIAASDMSAADQAAGFTYEIDWNSDGTIDEILTGLDGHVINHTFAVVGQTTVTITATDKDGGVSAPVSHVVNVILHVTNQPVSLNLGLKQVSLNGNGVLPISILSTANFDVRGLDLSTLRLSGASAIHSVFEDVDQDGDLDLLLHFRRQDFVGKYAAALAADLVDGKLDNTHQDVELQLTGKTTAGADIFAAAMVDFFMSGNSLEKLLKSLT